MSEKGKENEIETETDVVVVDEDNIVATIYYINLYFYTGCSYYFRPQQCVLCKSNADNVCYISRFKLLSSYNFFILFINGMHEKIIMNLRQIVAGCRWQAE